MAVSTTETTARRTAKTKQAVVKVEWKDAALELEPGTYRKVGTRKIGTAFLSVLASGELRYTNRRGEERVISAKEFFQVWKTGIATRVA